MATIYITACNEDRDFALKLLQALHDEGHTILTPWSTSPPGSDTIGLLELSLPDIDIVIPIISNHSSSRSRYLSEIEFIVSYSRVSKSLNILPLVIDDNPEVPDSLMHFSLQYAAGRNTDFIIERFTEDFLALRGEKAAKQAIARIAKDKIKSSASDYIKKSLKDLESKEQSFRFTANIWYGLSYATLLFGALFALWKAFIDPPVVSDLFSLAGFIISGAIFLTLLIAMSKYAFTLGKSHMIESLRNADRRHAISFGEFCLNSLGEKLEWIEIKEAFQHWNIDMGSHFIDQNTKDYDPQILEIALEISKIITGINAKTRSKNK